MTLLADPVRDFLDAGRTWLRAPGLTVVAVSKGFWLRRLRGDPAAVGCTTTLDGSPHLVVGLVPRDFPSLAGGVHLLVPAV